MFFNAYMVLSTVRNRETGKNIIYILLPEPTFSLSLTTVGTELGTEVLAVYLSLHASENLS